MRAVRIKACFIGDILDIEGFVELQRLDAAQFVVTALGACAVGLASCAAALVTEDSEPQ